MVSSGSGVGVAPAAGGAAGPTSSERRTGRDVPNISRIRSNQRRRSLASQSQLPSFS